MVTREIFSIILPLTVGIADRLPKYVQTATASAFIMGIDVFNSDHNRRLQGDVPVGLDENHRAIADV